MRCVKVACAPLNGRAATESRDASRRRSPPTEDRARAGTIPYSCHRSTAARLRCCCYTASLSIYTYIHIIQRSRFSFFFLQTVCSGCTMPETACCCCCCCRRGRERENEAQGALTMLPMMIFLKLCSEITYIFTFPKIYIGSVRYVHRTLMYGDINCGVQSSRIYRYTESSTRGYYFEV